MITITDTAGTSGTATVDTRDEAMAVIRQWFADAPEDAAAEVASVIDEMETNWRNGDYTGNEQAYLAIQINVEQDTPGFGTLVDYRTGEPIGPATQAQRDASRAAGDVGAFTIDRDGDPCPDSADAAVFGPLRSVFVQE